MDFRWNILIDHIPFLMKGALLTLVISGAAVLFGSLLAGLLYFSYWTQDSKPHWIKAYVEIFRSLPILVLLIWFNYGLPQLFSISISSLWITIIVLALNFSAYLFESIRSGIESIHIEQIESAKVFGLSDWHIFRYILYPQALPRILPNFINQCATQIKMSSLASIIGVNELLHTGNLLISDTFRPFEIYTGIAVIYLAMILPISSLSRHLEKQKTLRLTA